MFESFLSYLLLDFQLSFKINLLNCLYHWQNAQCFVRLCSICEGRISALKRWLKTPFMGVLFMQKRADWGPPNFHYCRSQLNCLEDQGFFYCFFLLAMSILHLLPLLCLPLTCYLWHFHLWHYYLWHYYLWHFFTADIITSDIFTPSRHIYGVAQKECNTRGTEWTICVHYCLHNYFHSRMTPRSLILILQPFFWGNVIFKICSFCIKSHVWGLEV